MNERLCGEHAVFRFTWPGKPESHVCVDHAMQVGTIAAAMSLPLQMIPLGYRAGDPIPEEFPTCKQVLPPERNGPVNDSTKGQN